MFANPANFSSTVDVHAHLIHVDETKLKAIANVDVCGRRHTDG